MVGSKVITGKHSRSMVIDSMNWWLIMYNSRVNEETCNVTYWYSLVIKWNRIVLRPHFQVWSAHVVGIVSRFTWLSVEERSELTLIILYRISLSFLCDCCGQNCLIFLRLFSKSVMQFAEVFLCAVFAENFHSAVCW